MVDARSSRCGVLAEVSSTPASASAKHDLESTNSLMTASTRDSVDLDVPGAVVLAPIPSHGTEDQPEHDAHTQECRKKGKGVRGYP